MRAAVFEQAGKPLTLEDRIAEPRPAADEVIIAVARAGICGSDLHITEYGAVPEGTILGHEFAGEIVALGADVTSDYRVGDRVTALPLNACDDCEACYMALPGLCRHGLFTGVCLEKPGAYAEFVATRVAMLQRLPSGVSFDQGGMIEPLAVAHHTVELAAIEKGAAVLVIGAGPIGAGVALFARLAGATDVVVSEPSASRRQRTRDAGATAVIDPRSEDVGARFRALTGRSPQIVVECVGIPGLLEQAIQLAGVRGRIVVAGVCFGEDTITPLAGLSKEASIQFSQCYTERNFEQVIDLVARGEARPDPLHTDTIGFDQLPETFELLRTATDQCKVLIDPTRP